MEWIRGEMVGPSRAITDRQFVEFTGRVLNDPVSIRRGPAVWRPTPDSEPEEVLYYERETPHRKYGMGLLHPQAGKEPSPDIAAAEASDTQGFEPGSDDAVEAVISDDRDVVHPDEGGLADDSEDFDVTSPDVRHPSTMGISFCVKLDTDGRFVVRLPRSRVFSWQHESSKPILLNGRYDQCERRWKNEAGLENKAPVWRRHPAVLSDCEVSIERSELVSGTAVRKVIPMPEASPIALRVEAFPRRMADEDLWLITLVLRNTTRDDSEWKPQETLLYQTFFEMSVVNGSLQKYPESQRPFAELDREEQSLVLLYRESATWGIGHSCAAGWDSVPGQNPVSIYADVMPAVELPSMTPDISESGGEPIVLSMRALSELPDDGTGAAWTAMENLAKEYASWIESRRAEVLHLHHNLQPTANEHLDICESCLTRIRRGISHLRNRADMRAAFRLANLAMLLQQIGTKHLKRRPLHLNQNRVTPSGAHLSPWNVFEQRQEGKLGLWRAFQIAFLLLSIEGVADGESHDRQIVDLIWFPTGGGKTEAYLGVMAFYMFLQRLIPNSEGGLPTDGTNVLMRYTLRMLTTQQFQRAAALICSMEFLRRNPVRHRIGQLSGGRFSLGLWIGGDGSPNKCAEANRQLTEYRRERIAGNPLVITECPWCRAEIGRYDGPRPARINDNQWRALRVKGVSDTAEGPLLHCSDGSCAFGQEQMQSWLPIEVIDERLYRNPPSLVIATADKLAMVAYRPAAGSLFGKSMQGDRPVQVCMPPGLIIQDELHLISGPLGTMYALYEGVFERLCSYQKEMETVKPKIIASTATIRGAHDQVLALYNRRETLLFPSPGLHMGDSFFGKYARNKDDTLSNGRMYFGIHANDYGSILTTQVRAFSSALFRPHSQPPDQRDPWWTLLVFYNSIRELSGAKTLFDSDIRSRLKFMFNREGFGPRDRRNLKIVEELTSRLAQSEIVGMMDRLSEVYSPEGKAIIDACLASNIIEVGVDIDRLSLMGVIGQPKTTAQYIQVTGRVGRRWWERPGLILMIYNPSKSRDRSHYEQFHTYHRRLYERVEPTSATPFALSAIQRALPGALITWARQHCNSAVQSAATYRQFIDEALEFLKDRCRHVQIPADVQRSIDELDRIGDILRRKWGGNPQSWEEFPPAVTGEYLMLWPGQFWTALQKQNGVVVPTNMRQVDGSAELNITQGYALEN